MLSLNSLLSCHVTQYILCVQMHCKYISSCLVLNLNNQRWLENNLNIYVFISLVAAWWMLLKYLYRILKQRSVNSQGLLGITSASNPNTCAFSSSQMLVSGSANSAILCQFLQAVSTTWTHQCHWINFVLLINGTIPYFPANMYARQQNLQSFGSTQYCVHQEISSNKWQLHKIW